jgi:hypothetical protein
MDHDRQEQQDGNRHNGPQFPVEGPFAGRLGRRWLRRHPPHGSQAVLGSWRRRILFNNLLRHRIYQPHRPNRLGLTRDKPRRATPFDRKATSVLKYLRPLVPEPCKQDRVYRPFLRPGRIRRPQPGVKREFAWAPLRL